jgi:hypothetical protein
MCIYLDHVHLVCKDVEELHAFAAKIGLKRCWFQNHRIPHYDLTTMKMKHKALNAGAKLLTTKEIIRLFRK